MGSLRERVNAHLPIVLQFFSTISLVVIASSAICGSQSLKKLVDSHRIDSPNQTQKLHIHQNN